MKRKLNIYYAPKGKMRPATRGSVSGAQCKKRGAGRGGGAGCLHIGYQ